MARTSSEIEYVLPTFVLIENDVNALRIILHSQQNTERFLLKVAEAFIEHNFEIKTFYYYVDKAKNESIADLVLYFKGDHVQMASKVEKLLQSMKRDFSFEYEVVEPEYRKILGLPNVKKLKMSDGTRAMIFPEENIVGTYALLVKEYGKTGELLLRKLGNYVGEELARKNLKIFGSYSRDLSLYIKLLLIGGQSKGMYHVRSFTTSKSFNKDIYRIELDSFVEEEALMKEKIESCSSYQLGILEGYISVLLKEWKTERRIKIEETSCISKGHNTSVFEIIIESKSVG